MCLDNLKTNPRSYYKRPNSGLILQNVHPCNRLILLSIIQDICRTQVFCHFGSIQHPWFLTPPAIIKICQYNMITVAHFFHYAKYMKFIGQKRQHLTLCMLGNFSCFSCGLLTFSKKIYQKHDQSARWFGSRSGLTYLSVLILVPTVCETN